MKENNEITFFSAKPTKCPVCSTEFYLETLRTGRGRLNADKLTLELRRKYRPTEKYGEICPLLYPVIVCPECYYAAFDKDFNDIKQKEVDKLSKMTSIRKRAIKNIFDDLNFKEERDYKEGIASYYLGIASYDLRIKDKSPTIKQGICALRAAWLFLDLHNKMPNSNYDYLAKLFYKKASLFYKNAVEFEMSGSENFSNVAGLGPDLDKNYGFDGVLYLSTLLEYQYGDTSNPEKRLEDLKKARTRVSRVFGMGKSNKNKPQEILDRARDLYNELGEFIEGEEDDDSEYDDEE